MELLTIVLLSLGIIIIAATLVLALKVPLPTTFQLWVFRVLMGLGAACLGAVIPGFIEFGGNVGELAVRSGGAIALFVMIYLISPPPFVRTSIKEETGT